MIYNVCSTMLHKKALKKLRIKNRRRIVDRKHQARILAMQAKFELKMQKILLSKL